MEVVEISMCLLPWLDETVVGTPDELSKMGRVDGFQRGAEAARAFTVYSYAGR
jgi:hypothetical protein